jgi:hypothetical protein
VKFLQVSPWSLQLGFLGKLGILLLSNVFQSLHLQLLELDALVK